VVQGDEGPAQSLPRRRPGSFGWGIRALHRLATATMVPFPRRLPHTISLLKGDGFEPSVPGAKEPVSGGEGDLRVIETEASHKKLFLLRGTDISNPSSSSSESAAKRTVAAPRAGRRRAPITGEGTESKKAIRRASVARPVASHTTGTARRTRAKVTDFYFGTKM
jgi:hypothetical protein